jgi:inorganic phosphate transporter, PiT family
MFLFFLSSGLFLGWSLGANDAANVFGTAVGSRMVRFKTAATVCSIFVILGAVFGGAGATHTLGKLGAVNALAGSFMVAFSAALTVYGMTRLRLPVSTSQAVVGAIIGWNLFSGSLTDSGSLIKIVTTWIACPLLAAVFGIVLYKSIDSLERKARLHLFRIDSLTRFSLLAVGAFGSWSLGANNIANVVGVFVPVVPFGELDLGLFTLSGAQQLFLLGSLAISVGVFTYSDRVMSTVGGSLLRLSPQMALVVVLAESLVLFLFSSTALEAWLVSHGLPSIPLVPVSSSQAVVGAVIGVAIARGGKGIKYNVLGEISTGWITTPVIAGLITFIALFFLQNVFDQKVYQDQLYSPKVEVLDYLELDQSDLIEIKSTMYHSETALDKDLRKNTDFEESTRSRLIDASLIENLEVNMDLLSSADRDWLTIAQQNTLQTLDGEHFIYAWQLFEKLAALDIDWKTLPKTATNKTYNKNLEFQRDRLRLIFGVTQRGD